VDGAGVVDQQLELRSDEEVVGFLLGWRYGSPGERVLLSCTSLSLSEITRFLC